LRKFLRESGRLSWVEFIESGVDSGAFSLLPCIVSNRHVINHCTVDCNLASQTNTSHDQLQHHVIAIRLAVLYACVHDAYLIVHL